MLTSEISEPKKPPSLPQALFSHPNQEAMSVKLPDISIAVVGLCHMSPECCTSTLLPPTPTTTPPPGAMSHHTSSVQTHDKLVTLPKSYEGGKSSQTEMRTPSMTATLMMLHTRMLCLSPLLPEQA